MNQRIERPRLAMKPGASFLMLFVLSVVLVVTPMRVGAAWNVTLSGGVGMGEETSFLKGSVGYGLENGDWLITPGANAILSSSAIEFNGSLTGAFILSEQLALNAGVEGGLGLTADIYCHLNWHVGTTTRFGATRISVLTGARSRTVWRCEKPSQQYFGLQLLHAASGRREMGIGIRFPYDRELSATDVELVLSWRF